MLIEVLEEQKKKDKKVIELDCSRAVNGLAAVLLNGSHCCYELQKCPNRCKTGSAKFLSYIATDAALRDDFYNLITSIENNFPSEKPCPECGAMFTIKRELGKHLVVEVSYSFYFCYCSFFIELTFFYTHF